jgi:dTDP-4-dehydrorhamnose reductase
MKHFILGASGLIGSALFKTLNVANNNVFGTYTQNTKDSLFYYDMSEKGPLCFINSIDSSDVVYILAAYSNPSWIFSNLKAANELNVSGTKFLIDQLRTINPRIIFMSSVEVFDGIEGDYSEFSKPNPINHYGKMKLQIEKYLTDTYFNSTIVRTGWNIGQDVKSRCVVKLTYESLIKPNAKMARDNFFSISSVEDTAHGLTKIASSPLIKICHICSNEVINRVQLAKLILTNSKNSNKMNFKECLFEEITYSEPRGRHNNLNNSLSKSNFSLEYMDSIDIILQKIKLIDSYYD